MYIRVHVSLTIKQTTVTFFVILPLHFTRFLFCAKIYSKKKFFSKN